MEFYYKSELTIPDHTHEAPYFSLAIEGCYLEQVGAAARSCTPSKAVFHPAGERHADHFDNRPVRLFMVEPSPGWLQNASDYRVPTGQPIECSRGPVWWLLSQTYREFSRWDDAAPLVIEGLLLEIAGAAKRRAGAIDRRAPHWLSRCRDLVRASCSRPIRLAEMAASEGVHPVQLAREFRRFYGCTAGEYLRRTRIEMACRKLSESDEPLSQIALACGFASQSHFSASFRRLVGMTPGEYRERRDGSSFRDNGAKS
jgi:AraC family transcriptional regulator